MVIVDQPESAFTYKRNIFSTDALEFIAELETLGPETAVGYLSGKLEATRGVWIRVGQYRIANGSFIDPSDLMLYVEQYFKPEENGPVCALELNHGGAAPDDALAAATLDELLDALVQLDLEANQDTSGDAADEKTAPEATAPKTTAPSEHSATAPAEPAEPAEEPRPAEDAPAEGEQAERTPELAFAAEGDAGSEAQAGGEAQVSEDPEENLPPSRFEGMSIVAPSGALEMHGALTKGWHAMYYEAADGSSLLVFE